MLREKEDLIAIGAYQPGSDPALDAALAHRTRIERFLRQPVRERSDPAETDSILIGLAASLSEELERTSGEIPDAEEVPPDALTGATAGGPGEPPAAGVPPNAQAPGAVPPATLQLAPIALPAASPAIPQLGLSI